MDDLQSALASLLENPKELEELAKTASSILEGDGGEGFPSPSELKKLISGWKDGEDSASGQILSALRPYLSDQRRFRLERAARIARIYQYAEVAFGSELLDG